MFGKVKANCQTFFVIFRLKFKSQFKGKKYSDTISEKRGKFHVEENRCTLKALEFLFLFYKLSFYFPFCFHTLNTIEVEGEWKKIKKNFSWTFDSITPLNALYFLWKGYKIFGKVKAGCQTFFIIFSPHNIKKNMSPGCMFRMYVRMYVINSRKKKENICMLLDKEHEVCDGTQI